MRYLLDIHASPPMVVLVHDSADYVAEVGQRYADQVRRPLVVAVGPAPADASLRPYVPELPVEQPAGTTGVGVVERPPAAVARAVVSYDPDRITAEQRAALASLGITL